MWKGQEEPYWTGWSVQVAAARTRHDQGDRSRPPVRDHRGPARHRSRPRAVQRRVRRPRRGHLPRAVRPPRSRPAPGGPMDAPSAQHHPRAGDLHHASDLLQRQRRPRRRRGIRAADAQTSAVHGLRRDSERRSRAALLRRAHPLTASIGRDAALGWNWTYWHDVLKGLLAEIGPHGKLHPALLVPGSGPELHTTDPTTEVRSRRVGGTDLWVMTTRSGRGTRDVTISGLPHTITAGTHYRSNRAVTVAQGSVHRHLLPVGRARLPLPRVTA